MGKARTRKVLRGPTLALTAAGLLLAQVALAEGEEANVSHFTDSSSDRPPAVTAFPKYPSVALRDRIEGEAVVCFNIDARGRVVRPSIRSSTHRIFEKPAMSAIRRSSFAPLAAGEKPAAAKACRTYRFRLDPINAQNGEQQAPEDADSSTTSDPATTESVVGQALD
jgi:TonB family protein